jgi:hypothetical protein
LVPVFGAIRKKRAFNKITPRVKKGIAALLPRVPIRQTKKPKGKKLQSCPEYSSMFHFNLIV